MFLAQAPSERLRLASWPRPYVTNPYTWRLALALRAHGVSTLSRRYLAELVARPAGSRWLHLHWPEWMLQDASRPRALARAAWFFSLLDAARARGLRLAWTAHNELGHDEPHEDLALRWRRALVRRCELAFGHFPRAEDTLRAWGFRGSFYCIPHPHWGDDYPEPPPRALARAALGYGPEHTVLLSFGALDAYKRPLELARAFTSQAPPNARLLLAGRVADPTLRAALASLCARDPRVRLWEGPRSAAEAALCFGAADGAAVAYARLFTSGVAVQALGYGVPVLGPPVAHLEALASSGAVVPLAELAQLGDALRALARVSEEEKSRARAAVRAWGWREAAGAVAEALRAS